MSSITATAVPGNGYVRVEVDWSDIAGPPRKAWVYRVLNGVTTTLRDSDPVLLSGGRAIIYDTEVPLDTAVTYRSTVALNVNGDMEDGVTEWTDTTNTGTIGTVTQSKDYYVRGEGLASLKLVPSGAATSRAVSEMVAVTPDARNLNPFFNTNASNWTAANGAAISRDTTNVHEGSGSLLIVPDGVTSTPQTTSDEVAVVAGQSYTYSAWLRISSGGSGSRNFGIRWYDASHVSLGADSVTSLSPAATVWTQYGPTTVTAPAGAAYARLISQGSGVLAAANTWRLDEAILYDPTTASVFTFSGRLMVPTFYGGGIGIQVHWYNGTTFLSSAGAANDFWPSAGEFGTYAFAATAPATTNGMRIVAAIAGSAPKTMTLYADEMYITRSGVTTINSSSTTLASNGAGWWKDPLHPATMIKLVFDLGAACTTSGVVYGGISTAPTRAADSSLLDVNSSDLPVSTWSVRKGPQSGMRVGTVTTADRDAVYALHATGAPLLLQLPAAYNLADHYQQHGDLSEGYLGPDQRKTWRAFQSGFSQVYAPVGPAEGVFGVRYQDINKWATYQAAEAFGGGSYDTYNRTAVDTWSNTDSGDVYTLVGTAADFDINGSRGTMSVPAVSTGREARLAALSLTSVRIRYVFGGPTPTGTTSVTQAVRFRYVDANNFLDAQVTRNVGGSVTFRLRQVVGGSATVDSGAITLTGVALNADVAIWVDAVGTAVTGYAWVSGQPRPVSATAAITVAGTTAGAVTARVDTGSGVTGLPYVATFEELHITNLAGGTAQNTWWDLLQGEGHV